MRVLETLQQLAGAEDWRGVSRLERQARAVAEAVRTSMPEKAAWISCILKLAASWVAYRSGAPQGGCVAEYAQERGFEQEVASAAATAAAAAAAAASLKTDRRFEQEVASAAATAAAAAAAASLKTDRPRGTECCLGDVLRSCSVERLRSLVTITTDSS